MARVGPQRHGGKKYLSDSILYVLYIVIVPLLWDTYSYLDMRTFSFAQMSGEESFCLKVN